MREQMKETTMPAPRSAPVRSRKLPFALPALAALCAAAGIPGSLPASGQTGTAAGKVTPTLAGPYTYGNLALYVVRGASEDDRSYITLDQGLAARTVEVREQGAAAGRDQATVNSVEIHNKSDQWLFLQAGDIVRGGKQDRTIMTDVLLPPHSRPQSIDAFCVERGRWTPAQDGLAFRANPGLVSGAALKRAIQSEKNQSRVWQEVARAEERAVTVAALANDLSNRSPALSRTGTYNAIAQHTTIATKRTEYVNALLPSIRKHKDALGLAVAVNGRMVAADVYASAPLFAALSGKLLESYALEAVLTRDPAKHVPPGREQVTAFLEQTSAAPASTEVVGESMRRSTRETTGVVMYEYRYAAPGVARKTAPVALHKSYVKK
jgi:hypothetical protein